TPPPPPGSPPFPYATLFRSTQSPIHHWLPLPIAPSLRPSSSHWERSSSSRGDHETGETSPAVFSLWVGAAERLAFLGRVPLTSRSEEHTSGLQSRENLVCRL